MQDQNTTVEELKSIVKAYCEARDWDQFHDAKELAMSITIESAELLELFRFKSREDMRQMFENAGSREKIGDELADVLFAVLRFAQLYGIDLTEEFCRKMKENEKKYPVEKARGSNKKYNEL
ncbi:MAG TPA: nucleotide pyrophosphohydrolase [Methanocella sp.]|jgi:NTP pyrophosphatase (non-canonical NTP hydrolase)